MHLRQRWRLVKGGVIWCMTAISAHCFGALLPVPPELLCPVGTDGTVIVAHGHLNACAIAAYDVLTGRLRWHEEFPEVAFVGELKVCQDSLYAPTIYDGVYVLDVQSGRLIQHLQVGQDSYEPKVACTSSHIFVAGVEASTKTEDVIALDATNFGVVWKRTIPQPSDPYVVSCSIREVVPKAHRVEVLLCQTSHSPPSYKGVTRYEQLELRASDGQIISRTPVARPAHYDIIPATLAPAIRTLLTQLLRGKTPTIEGMPPLSPEELREEMAQLRKERPEFFLWERTSILRSGELLFIGRIEYEKNRYTLFAINCDTAQIVWHREVPALEYIILHKSSVIAATWPRPTHRDQAKSLMALDAQTGRVLWTAELPAITCPSPTPPGEAVGELQSQGGGRRAPGVRLLAVTAASLVGVIVGSLIWRRYRQRL